MYHPIARREEPWTFQLGWRAKDRAITVRIHPDICRDPHRPVEATAPIVTHFQKTFGLGSFSGAIDRHFGFDEGMASQRRSDGSITLVAALPAVQHATEDPCSHCDGSGKSPIDGDRCFLCRGGGRE